jgi:VIT1/CCC1 family predicted Fe2+/Mn2+ transporter
MPRSSDPRHYSYGSTAATATSVGLVVGFDAASVSRAAIVSGLLIIALADNISDSLSIHMYQESENLETRAAFRTTVANFAARLAVASSFIAIVLVVPMSIVPAASVIWAALLLGSLTHIIARIRHVSPLREMLKHVVVAFAVVAVSRILGGWIAATIH